MINETLCVFEKSLIRTYLKNKRKAISLFRREEASKALLFSFSEILSSHSFVLSFMSTDEEIDMMLINFYLARTRRLVLPNVNKKSLDLFLVEDPKSQLFKSSHGILEPNETCKPVSPHSISIALVPGLGFDLHNYRIGYGQGYYDRFLSSLSHCSTIGIGFKEQLIDVLPKEETDIPLSQICLF